MRSGLVGKISFQDPSTWNLFWHGRKPMKNQVMFLKWQLLGFALALCCYLQKQVALEISVKALKEGQNMGFDPPFRELSIKSFITYRVSEPRLKVGGVFGTSFLHLAYFETILRFKTGHVHGTRCPPFRIDLCKASLAHPPIPVNRTRKLMFNSSMPLFVSDNIKRKLDGFVLILINSNVCD